MKYLLFLLTTVLLILSCDQEPKELIIRSPSEVVNGEKVYRKVRDFSFINQDSAVVTNETFKDKIYITNFFFTSCPDICPPVNRQMLRVHDHFLDDDRVRFLSHSIDVKYDSIPALKEYADLLGVAAPKWNFITGEEEEIFEIAYDYYATAIKSPEAPSGFDHDDQLVLVDKNGLLRSSAHGMEEKDVDRFIQDVELLLKTEYPEKK
ncbi:MAG: SCO family protein [Bacteroidota bacterium]